MRTPPPPPPLPAYLEPNHLKNIDDGHIYLSHKHCIDLSFICPLNDETLRHASYLEILCYIL